MALKLISDKRLLERYLRKNIPLHIYEVGDLDERYWPDTTWYGLGENHELQAVVLMFSSHTGTTLLALTNEIPPMSDLLGRLISTLPDSFYAHISPGAENILKEHFRLSHTGKLYKMRLQSHSEIQKRDYQDVARLTEGDADALLRLYNHSYPGHWFVPSLLIGNPYFGVWENDRLISVAGTHVHSEKYRVAAIGNITTHPEYRRQGYCARVTGKLCRHLSGHVDYIGLNVNVENNQAVSCYRHLGFEPIAEYNEYSVKRK